MTTVLFDQGVDVALNFKIENVGAGTTPVDGTLASGQGAQGFVVPTGWKFAPFMIIVEYNAARTAGTSTVKVTDALAEVSNGPEATIDGTNTTLHQGTSTVGEITIAAGQEVSVSATGDGSFAPTTADADVVLIGKLLPV